MTNVIRADDCNQSAKLLFFLILRFRIIHKQIDLKDQKISIKANEGTYTTIFHDTLESIIVAGEDGIIIIANPTSEKMFGYQSGALIGINVDELIPKDKRVHHKSLRKIYVNDPAPRQMGKGRDLIGLSKGGRKFPIEISLTPTTITNKRVVIAFIIDISERKKMEEALQLSEKQLIKYAAQLEKRVEERTKKLAEALEKMGLEVLEKEKAQEKTKLALEKEKELNALKSRFVSMASHEFRTPLSTILSSVSLVSKYDGPENHDKREKHIKRIKAKVSELTEILNDFLSFDKLEQDKFEYQPESIELVSFMQNECEGLQLIVKNGQALRFTSDSETCEINVDPKVIKHVLANLCSNAIKYSPENGEIRIRLEVLKHSVSISIIDQGIGIPEVDQKHLFERFFRAHNSTHIQGTGLGLNLVKRYVGLANGTIRFESKEGSGSTFIVTLPM